MDRFPEGKPVRHPHQGDDHRDMRGKIVAQTAVFFGRARSGVDYAEREIVRIGP